MAINKPLDNAVPFAQDGLKNTIPVESGNGNAASMTLGFPPITMQPKSTGGLPPSGKDMNAILNQLSQHQVWLNAGGMYPFSADYAAQIGGYHTGAVVQSDDGRSAFISIQDNNANNPNQLQTGWKPYGGQILLTTLANAIFHIGYRFMTGNSSYNPAIALEALFGYQTTWYLWPYIPVGVANTSASLGEIVMVGGAGIQAATTRIWERLPDGASAPTYNLTATQTTVNEGAQVTFNLATTGVAQGTPVDWNITGIQSADISPNALSGQFIVGADGTASKTITIVADEVTEGTETLKFTLTYISGKFVNVTISDTSILPEQIVTISSDQPAGLNLRSAFVQLYGEPTANTKAVFVVESGVTIVAATAESAAIYCGVWASGSTREIRIMSNALVAGRGGKGGDGGGDGNVGDPGWQEFPAQDGETGGTAIEAEIGSPVTVNNYGLIAGGAGGGGAGGGAGKPDGTVRGMGSSPGGGGAPYGLAGVPRYSNYDVPSADRAKDATLNTGGQGGASYTEPSTAIWAAGGNGGNIGLNGQVGGEAQSGNSVYMTPGQSGGLAGFIYQGPVTINNLSDGQTKGRTP
ncbi:MAG: hypothetical protein EOO69_04440 [Moraxellaceae bacterium]|nr:MAG: hypothetical protein EOO69_04440 [Moraxellaceae bacterium]